MKKICLLGATGSIGKSALDIISRFPDKFSVHALSAHSAIDALYALAEKFHPSRVALSGSGLTREWQQRFASLGVEIDAGESALVHLAADGDYDLLVNAIVGAAGLAPTLAAIRQGKSVALANKETLVTAGQLVTELAAEKQARLFPIDSEHSALWQCLIGEDPTSIERIILTASGGPFRDLPADQFRHITVEQALNHPNWSMGPKITVDSATLMNKGLEVIEAYWLFRVPIDAISVLIHPQSIIHSMVEFRDGSIKAQLSLPDMRIPIQYALSFPERIENDLPRMNFSHYNQLTFYEPEQDKFPALDLAYRSLREAGTAPAVLNAANEEAVHAFLARRIRFDHIPVLVAGALNRHVNNGEVTLEAITAADRWARRFVRKRIAAGI